jgi:hypothetical protein
MSVVRGQAFLNEVRVGQDSGGAVSIAAFVYADIGGSVRGSLERFGGIGKVPALAGPEEFNFWVVSEPEPDSSDQ